MANEPVMTITGRIARDPELKFGKDGKAIASFTVASTPRRMVDREWVDGTTLWMRCTAFGRLAENVAESLEKGHPVVVTGRVQQNDWTDKEGQARQSIEMVVETCGHDLRWVTTTPHKAPPKEQTPQEKPRASRAPAPSDDEPPF